MDNNEEKNIPTNDFEIIDIPNAEDNNQTVDNNQFEQLENNMPVEQIFNLVVQMLNKLIMIIYNLVILGLNKYLLLMYNKVI